MSDERILTLYHLQYYNVQCIHINQLLTRNRGKYTRIQRGNIIKNTPAVVLQHDLSQGWHTSQHWSLTFLQSLSQFRDKLIAMMILFNSRDYLCACAFLRCAYQHVLRVAGCGFWHFKSTRLIYTSIRKSSPFNSCLVRTKLPNCLAGEMIRLTFLHLCYLILYSYSYS